MISFLWKEQYPHKPIHIHVDPSPLKVIDYQVKASYDPSINIEPLPDHAPANSVLIDANKIIGEAGKM